MKKLSLTTAILIIALLITISINSCKHDVIVPTSPVISFKTDVQPMIIGNCTQSGCHGNGHSSGHGGEDDAFPLLTYNDVMNRGNISPGSPDNSRIYTAITSGKMPRSPYPPVPDQGVLKLYIWILQGALNN